MSVWAFKSTSKRGTLGSCSSRTNKESSENPPQKVPPRRSRSVSALSRTHFDPSSEFLNKRDNPLFRSSASPPKIEPANSTVIAKFDDNTTGIAKSDAILYSKVGGRRGRSVSRNGEGSRKEIGRSLDVRRRGQSVSSREHHDNFETEVDQEFRSPDGIHLKLVSTSSELSDQKTWSSQHHPPCEPLEGSASCSQILNWEDDGGWTTSVSEAEEKTIKAEQKTSKVASELMKGHPLQGSATSGIYETVRSEVRRAISDIQNDLENAMRSNATTIVDANVADIPPELINSGGVDLVLDIRREYAKELEQSQERVRRLRADLALEEQRGQELSRILKEILPDPKTSDVQKFRPGRKTSIERRKMSKRLTEEAMAYFDECVSISTFDNSDFSSQEDTPLNMIGAGDSGILPQDSGYNLSRARSSSNADEGEMSSNGVGKLDSSFDLMNCVKKFERESGVHSEIVKSNYYESNLKVPPQSLLFDRVFLKNRIQSGSLLLCGGGGGLSTGSM